MKLPFLTNKKIPVFLNFLLSVSVGLIVGVIFIFAYTGPTANPPSGDVLPPVRLQTSTPGDQQTGDINVSGAALFGGNVGIGTTGPTTNLHIYGTGSGNITLEQASPAQKWEIRTDYAGSDALFYAYDRTNSKAPLVIENNSGNVGIGTTEPSAKLYVKTTDLNTVPFQVETLIGCCQSVLGSSSCYRKEITIDHTKIDSDLTNFPVLVKLTTANFDFSKAKSDGTDIRFTSSDGETLLKYERERHDSANGLAEYWVKIPSVSSSADTIFYIYYGNSSASDGADPTNVWDSNFKGVWHLQDLTTSSVEDSTSNNNDGDKASADNPAEDTGKIYKAQTFSDDYIRKQPMTGQPTGNSPITLEAWAKCSSTGENVLVCVGADGSNPTAYGINITSSSYDKVRAHFPSGNGVVDGTTTISTNTWYYVAGVYDTSTNKIYLNGVEEGSISYSSGNLTDKGVSIGAWDAYTGSNKTVDEVRVSSVARSAAWIKASYNSGNDSLVSYGDEETSPEQQTTAFYIQNQTGNVGIGTTSPSAKLYVVGDIHKTGTVSFVEDYPGDSSKQIVYISLEGPEAGTYVRGQGQLINGEAEIRLPEHFSLVTEPNSGLTAQITPLDDCNDLRVLSLSSSTLKVKELNQGRSNAKFYYLIQGVRKGYQNFNPVQDKK